MGWSDNFVHVQLDAKLKGTGQFPLAAVAVRCNFQVITD